MSVAYPVGHPLHSSQLKAQRAYVHVRNLERAVRRRTRKPEIALTRKRDLQTVEGASVHTVTIDPMMGYQWGLIVGDIISNLRAALDHVAWSLAVRHSRDTRTPIPDRQAEHIYFPLRLTRAAPAKSNFKGLGGDSVRWFSDQARTDVELFQPYHRRNRPELKRLAVLSELVRVDKHRVVTEVFQAVDFRLMPGHPFVRALLDKPDSYHFVVDDALKDNLKPEMAPDVFLGVRGLFPEIFPLSEFRDMHDFIRDEVIPSFAGHVS
jgi:hypothetical protein